jgi:peptidoglycan hydrolase-like protein with peptidoglycan-binding domain
MNDALKAMIALVMGAGLAASAQAHGIDMHRSAMPGSAMHRAAAVTQRHARLDLSRQNIKTAQQQLKADGLYQGKVDGLFGPRTRRAVARFQERNRLRRTATLDRQTLGRLTGNQAVGIGSSRPKSSNMPLNRNGNAGRNANTKINGAGGNSGAINQTPSLNAPSLNKD